MYRNIPKPLLSMLVLPLLLQVSCTPVNTPAQVEQSDIASNDLTKTEPVFAKVISKRTLELNNTTLGNGSSPQSASLPATSDISVAPAPQPAATSLPGYEGDIYPSPSPEASGVPFPSSDISVGYAGAPGYGYGSPGYGYGGYMSGEFNNYVPITAEELTFAGSKESDLKTVYQKTVAAILNDWDSSARLLESRGKTKPEENQDYEYEYISLPGLEQDSELRFNARWVFRFASDQRKETLNVYINDTETRVYRVIYGEPNIDISRLNVSLAEAQTIARKAFADRSKNPGYPVYPDRNYIDSNSFVYEIPEDLNWGVNLVQNGNKLVYHLNFNYGYENPDAPQPEPSPTPSAVPSVTPTTMPSPELYDDVPFPEPTPCFYGYADPNVYGSISIDASSGKILSLDRPVYYGGSNSYCGGPTDYPTAYPDGTPIPLPRATSDL